MRAKPSSGVSWDIWLIPSGPFPTGAATVADGDVVVWSTPWADVSAEAEGMVIIV